MIDRSELLARSLSRISREADTELNHEINSIRRQGSALGSLMSGQTLISIQEACKKQFSSTCISILEKVRLEEHENTAEISEQVLREVIAPLQIRLLNQCGEAAFGPKNLVLSNEISTQRRNFEGGLRLDLSNIKTNVFEEFQLAITRQSPPPIAQKAASTYVALERIKSLSCKTADEWDFTRLVSLCEEINAAWSSNSHHAVAMLTRAILDHVPPIFGHTTFVEVINNYGGTKAFKQSMQHLNGASRAIANDHLHSRIRSKEALPTENQVDFRSGIDLLLAEIDRITH